MTTKLAPETYLQFWEAASGYEYGIEVKVPPDDHAKMLNALYEARKTFGGYEDVIIFSPPPQGTIFMMKNTVELPE